MGKFFKKLTSGVIAMAMVFSLMPSTAFAATSSETVAAKVNGTYTGTAQCKPDDDDDFKEYTLSLDVTLADGKITAISNVQQTTGTDYQKNKISSYISDAVNGMVSNIIDINGTEGIVDLVTEATCTSQAILDAVDDAIAAAEDKTDEEDGGNGEDDQKQSEEDGGDDGDDQKQSEEDGEEEEDDDDADEAEYVYVTMNIPYADFYAAELNNDVAVDSVTSATSSKWKSQSGTYYGDNKIYGVQYPVLIAESALEGLNEVSSLGTAGDYAYTTLSDTPSAYKKVTVNENGSYSFSAVVASETAISPSVSISTSSNYGDYQLEVSSLSTSGTLVGVVISCDNGKDYGLRALENIWRSGSQLSWSTGFKTTESKGNTLSYAHYVSMMGSTITSIKYITTSGVYVASTSLIVQGKYDGEVSVEDALLSAESTTVDASALPEAMNKVYTLSNENLTYEDGKITWDASEMSIGSYTLTVSDENGMYVSTSTTFEIMTDEVVAVYNEDNESPALVKANEDVEEDDFSAYIAAITTVTINGTEYTNSTSSSSSSTQGGAPGQSQSSSVNIINEDGSINLEATTTSGMGPEATTVSIFEDGVYVINVSAAGYSEDINFVLYVGDVGDVYVLMNVPYAKFYAADLNNDVEVDVFTSATKNKSRTGTLAGGSYHEDETGSTIAGITFPVKISADDLDVLEDYIRITDNDSVSISVTNKGTTSTTTYEGSDALFESASYSYYVLYETPSYYKELSVEDDELSFGKVVGEVTEIEGTYTTWTQETSYGDYELDLSSDVLTSMGISSNSPIYGVIINTVDEDETVYNYGLRHVENIWLGVKLAWCVGYTETVHNCPTSSDHYKAMIGQTITSITYYTENGIYLVDIDDIEVTDELLDTEALKAAIESAKEITAAVEDGALYSADSYEAFTTALSAAEEALEKYVRVSKSATQETIDKITKALTDAIEALEEAVYVMMNIPYAEFYEAEISNEVAVDTVSSATSSKWKSQSGTYYEADEEGSGGTILGVQYPVLIAKSALTDLVESDSDNIKTAVTYAYYELEEAPSAYKAVSVDEDGNFSFSKVVAEAESIEPTLSFSTSTNYGDYQLNVSNLSVSGTLVGVVVSCDNETDYALRALENIWRSGAQLSWSTGIKTTESHGNTLSYEHYESIMGSTIEKVTFITTSGVYEVDANILVQIKYSGSISVEDAEIDAESITVDVSELPEEMSKEYSVADGFTVEEGEDDTVVITWDDSVGVGSYTLTVSDANGLYVSASDSFTLYTNEMPAAYNDDDDAPALVKASDDVTTEELEAYIAAITTVTVNGTAYTNSTTSSGQQGGTTASIIDANGNIDLNAEYSKSQGKGETVTGSVFDDEYGKYQITISATGYAKDLTFIIVTGEYIYVTMNIPYAEFYAAEYEDGNKVDTVSSATSSIRISQTASYFEATVTGGTILGVQYPVLVSKSALEAMGAVLVTSDSETKLAESGTYAYTELTSVPSAYKTVSVETDEDGNVTVSFSAVIATTTELEDVAVTIATESSYGDYQLAVSLSDKLSGSIAGVILGTEEGDSYGLRALENIWRSGQQLSWSTGFSTTEKHGNTLSYENYESLMGQTITSITYITTDGVYVVNCSLYVAVKYDAAVSVADADVSDCASDITIEGTLPEDGSWKYSVEGLSVSDDNGKVTWESALPGTYTLTVSDESGKYVSISASFTLSTTELAAKYNEDDENPAIVAADGASEEALSNYLGNITSVSVNGTEYATSGRDSATIVNADGTINLEAAVSSGMGDEQTTTSIFDGDGEYEIVVTATGYPKLSFTLTISSEEASDDDSQNDGNSDADSSDADSSDADSSDKEASDADDAAETETDGSSEDASSETSSAPVLLYQTAVEYDAESAEDFTFASSAEISDFVEVLVDGETLDPAYYTVVEGSTVVTVSGDYMSTLSEGEHVFSIVSTTGTVDATISVVNAAADDSDDETEDSSDESTTSSSSSTSTAADTGDAASIYLYAAMVLTAAMAAYVANRRRKSNQ